MVGTPIDPAAGPDLAVTKTGPSSATPGESLANTLVVDNHGNQDASGVVLTETVPDHTTFDAAGSSASHPRPPRKVFDAMR